MSRQLRTWFIRSLMEIMIRQEDYRLSMLDAYTAMDELESLFRGTFGSPRHGYRMRQGINLNWKKIRKEAEKARLYLLNSKGN